MCEIRDARNVFIDENEVYCEDHGSPSKYVLKIGSTMIPMCEECLKELKEVVDDV